MKGSRLVEIVILIALLCSTSVLRAADRSVYKRLVMSLSNSHSTLMGGSSLDVFYNYVSSQSILLSSRIAHENSDIMGESISTYDIASTVTETESGRQIDYIATLVGEAEPAFTYMFVLDPQNRLVDSRHYVPAQGVGLSAKTQEIHRRYNSIGYPDSVYIKHTYGTTVYEKCFKRSFENSVLTHCIVYTNYSGAWTPNTRIRFTYAQDPVILPSFIRWDSLINQTITTDAIYDESCFNPRVIPLTISHDSWSNGQWYESNDYQHTQTFTDNQILMRSQSQSAMNSSQYIANTSGDIFSKETSWSAPDEGGGTWASYYWDSVVSNDDELVPEIIPSIKVYPNPFTESTNIRIENGSLSGSKVTIYNLRGQVVREMDYWRGDEVTWDGKDEQMQPVPRGVYLMKLETAKQNRIIKLMRY